MDKANLDEAKFKVPNFLPSKKTQLECVDSHRAVPLPSQSIQPVVSTATTKNLILTRQPVVIDVGENDDNASDSGTCLDSSRNLILPPSHHVSESDVSVVEELVHKKHTNQSSPESTLDTPLFPTLPYTEPHWSGTPTEPYFLSVIKNGIVNQRVDISKKPFHVFGRLPCCDIALEHPSLSRYHAILQYHPQTENGSLSTDENALFSINPSESGFYVYDLGSTHGTVINKFKLQARCYFRLRVGQMVKFGGSSRLFLLEVSSVHIYIMTFKIFTKI